jgi:hypothetical protein
MESHEVPIFITAPCYILAVDGYTVDISGQPVYDANLQFLSEVVGTAETPAVVIFTDRRLAENYIQQMDDEFPLRPLEIPNNEALKGFLRLATAAYRVALIDPEPETGTMQAGVLIEEILQNLDFPGITGL